MIKNLNEYKDLKAAQNEINELALMIEKLNDCIDILKPFHRHINMMESLSILHNSRTLFEIRLDKIKNEKA